jgi:hypothetical protein
MTAKTQDTPTDSEPDASAGWKAEYALQGVDTSIEADVQGAARDRREAANREDRTDRYRRKHARGVSS